MTYQNRRSTPGLGSALLLIVLILIGVFFGGDLKDKVKSLEGQEIEKEIALAAKNAELNELQEIQKSIPDNEAGQMKLLASIPTQLKEDELIKDFDSLTKENSISFDSINFDLMEQGEAGKVNKVRIYSSFKGTYTDLLKFIQAVEKNTRKISIKSISVAVEQPGKEKEDTAEAVPVTSFNLNMEAYYQGSL